MLHTLEIEVTKSLLIVILQLEATWWYGEVKWLLVVTWWHGEVKKKQDVVSRLSVESEYRAMVLRIAISYYSKKNLLTEFSFERKNYMPLYCDNQVAINVAKNLVFQIATFI